MDDTLIERAARRIRNTFDKRIDALTKTAIEESLVEIERAFEGGVCAADQWARASSGVPQVRLGRGHTGLPQVRNRTFNARLRLKPGSLDAHGNVVDYRGLTFEHGPCFVPDDFGATLGNTLARCRALEKAGWHVLHSVDWPSMKPREGVMCIARGYVLDHARRRAEHHVAQQVRQMQKVRRGMGLAEAHGGGL